MHLHVSNVTKKFGTFTALRDVSLEVDRGEFVAILGPSGCGKTTLLRVVAGLEGTGGGTVVLSGSDVTGLPPSRRNVGIVFQSYALFPNLTARENVAYGLKGRGRARRAIEARAQQMLELVGLEAAGGQYPNQLSGGQQQRVALARALAPEPSLLLLDEPLSALDARVRARLRLEVRQLQERLGVTTLMVTHDQEEALTMADRVVVMDRGEIVQTGTPEEIYLRPGSAFVADFVGSMNFLQGLPEGLRGALPGGVRDVVAIRPEDVRLADATRDGSSAIEATVRALEFRGPFYRLSLGLASGESAATEPTLTMDLSSEQVRRLGVARDSRLPIHLPPDRLRVYPGSPAPVPFSCER